MAIVTDLNGCFVHESDIVNGNAFDVKTLLLQADSVCNGILTLGVDDGFLFGESHQMLDLMRKQYDAGYVNQVYFRNGEFHDCAEDKTTLSHNHTIQLGEPSHDQGAISVAGNKGEHEVREMGGFKIGETVTFYRDESFAHLGVIENWNDGEDLKIIAFAHIWGEWLPVVQHARKQQVSPIVFECIKKKMTYAEIKARIIEIEELADNACEDLFGCSIQNCRNDVAATVRAMIEGDYRKQLTQENVQL